MSYGHDNNGADGGSRQAIDETRPVTRDAELAEHPATQNAADQSENNVGDAAEATAARKFSREPAGNQTDQEPANNRMAHPCVVFVDFRLKQRGEHEVSFETLKRVAM